MLLLLVGALAWDHPILPYSNASVFGMAWTKTGKHLVARGLNGQLWHIFEDQGTWTNWTQITQYCPKQVGYGDPPYLDRPCVFDSDPAVGVNADGRLEVFVRFAENLDVWQLYQTDASDPTKWSQPRESACVDQNQTTGKWYCLGTAGRPDGPNDDGHYWLGQPAFPTSDMTVLNDPKDQRLVVFYRGFTGNLFSVSQRVSGNSTYYTSPNQEGKTIIEAVLPGTEGLTLV